MGSFMQWITNQQSPETLAQQAGVTSPFAGGYSGIGGANFGYGAPAYTAAQAAGGDFSGLANTQTGEQALQTQLQQMASGNSAAQAQLHSATNQANANLAGTAAAVSPNNMAARSGLLSGQSNVLSGAANNSAQLQAQQEQAALAGEGALYGQEGQQQLGQAGLEQALSTYNTGQQNNALQQGSSQAVSQSEAENQAQEAYNSWALNAQTNANTANSPLNLLTGGLGVGNSTGGALANLGGGNSGGGGGGGSGPGGSVVGLGSNGGGYDQGADAVTQASANAYNSGSEDAKGAVLRDQSQGFVARKATMVRDGSGNAIVGEAGKEAVIPITQSGHVDLTRLKDPELLAMVKKHGGIPLPAPGSQNHTVLGKNGDGTFRVKMCSGGEINVHPEGLRHFMSGGLMTLAPLLKFVADGGTISDAPPRKMMSGGLTKLAPLMMLLGEGGTVSDGSQADGTNSSIEARQFRRMALGGTVTDGSQADGMNRTIDAAQFRRYGDGTVDLNDPGTTPIIPAAPPMPFGSSGNAFQGDNTPIDTMNGQGPGITGLQSDQTTASALGLPPLTDPTLVNANLINPNHPGGTQPLIPPPAQFQSTLPGTRQSLTSEATGGSASRVGMPTIDKATQAQLDASAKGMTAEGQISGEAQEKLGTSEADAWRAAQAASAQHIQDVQAQLRERQAVDQETFAKMQTVNDQIMQGVHRQSFGDYFGHQSTPGKVLTGIGLALSGIGAAGQSFVKGIRGDTSPTPNLAMDYINKAIGEDVEQQKTNLQAKDKGLEGLKSIYGMHLNSLGNEDAATQATYATQLGIVDQQIKQAMAGNISDQARAGLAGLSSNVTQSMRQAQQEALTFQAQQKMSQAQLTHMGLENAMSGLDLKQKKLMMKMMQDNPGAFGNPANVVVTPNGQRVNAGIGIEGQKTTAELESLSKEVQSAQAAKDFAEQHAGHIYSPVTNLFCEQKNLGAAKQEEAAFEASAGNPRLYRTLKEEMPNPGTATPGDLAKLQENYRNAVQRYSDAYAKTFPNAGATQ
jgi:hypothetical protein